jgi:hypothetical protein
MLLYNGTLNGASQQPRPPLVAGLAMKNQSGNPIISNLPETSRYLKFFLTFLARYCE